MRWVYKFEARAFKELRKLGPSAQKEIVAYLDEHVAGQENPRLFGKRLTANFSGLWRYRVGDYRMICQLRDHELVVLVIAVGHRKNIYR